MPWSTLKFGRHIGKSLPQVIFSDPDYFFWAVENNVFKAPLEREAADINKKACSIRIPTKKGERLVAEYVVHPPTGKFARLQIVPADTPQHEGSSPTFRMDVIAVVTMLDPVRLQKLIIRGVEGGGVWVECQALTNFMLEKFKLPHAPRVPIFFLSFQELRFAYYAENIPSLNEIAFGV